LVPDAPEPHARVCRDVRDDYLFALATHAGVEAIISGDRDVLEARDAPVPVLSPRDFVIEFDTCG